MKTKFVVGAAVVVFAGPLQAHHSVGVFDTATPILVKGIIAEVHFANPHSEIFVDVSDSGGQRVRWAVEGGPAKDWSHYGPLDACQALLGDNR